tara:strand:- start:1643 stop:2014 length:372 start_codon:yes stop_codon:yes gene_type:complete
MFGQTKTDLKNLKLEKTLIDREIDLYRREKMQMVNSDIENEKIKRLKEVANLEIQCHKQIADYEHEFHSTKEIKGIELAKIEAKLEVLNSIEPTMVDIISNKDKEIERLVNIINALTNNRTKK